MFDKIFENKFDKRTYLQIMIIQKDLRRLFFILGYVYVTYGVFVTEIRFDWTKIYSARGQKGGICVSFGSKYRNI